MKRQGKITTTCNVSGKEFLTWTCRLKTRFGKYCSRKSFRLERRGKPTWNTGTKGVMKPNRTSFKKGDNMGSKAYNWKGGNRRDTKNNIDYKEWRIKVFERDNYTCSYCGIRNGRGITVYLQAHHLMSWADFPKLRYDVENGTCLCKKCHIKFHKKFGFGNNDDEQFLFFTDFIDDKILKEV